MRGLLSEAHSQSLLVPSDISRLRVTQSKEEVLSFFSRTHQLWHTLVWNSSFVYPAKQSHSNAIHLVVLKGMISNKSYTWYPVSCSHGNVILAIVCLGSLSF